MREWEAENAKVNFALQDEQHKNEMLSNQLKELHEQYNEYKFKLKEEKKTNQ